MYPEILVWHFRVELCPHIKFSRPFELQSCICSYGEMNWKILYHTAQARQITTKYVEHLQCVSLHLLDFYLFFTLFGD